jgi:hypothetical protein
MAVFGYATSQANNDAISGACALKMAVFIGLQRYLLFNRFFVESV